MAWLKIDNLRGHVNSLFSIAKTLQLIQPGSCNITSMRVPGQRRSSEPRLRAKRFELVFCLCSLLCLVFSRPVSGEDFEFFEKRIRPVLVERCYKCHSLEADKLKGEFLLDSKEGILKGGSSGKPAIIPGNAEASRLIEAIRYSNEEFQMPPPKIGKLTAEQIADFVTWVNLGAPDPRAKKAQKQLWWGTSTRQPGNIGLFSP